MQRRWRLPHRAAAGEPPDGGGWVVGQAAECAAGLVLAFCRHNSCCIRCAACLAGRACDARRSPRLPSNLSSNVNVNSQLIEIQRLCPSPQGVLAVTTEFGRMRVAPGEICVIQRGMRFRCGRLCSDKDGVRAAWPAQRPGARPRAIQVSACTLILCGRSPSSSYPAAWTCPTAGRGATCWKSLPATSSCRSWAPLVGILRQRAAI